MTPFAIDLPQPPGANRMLGHGRGRVFRSREYAAWLQEADVHFLKLGLNNGRKPIEGRFVAKIYVRDGLRLDLDNYAKCLLDWAQRVGVIKNDKHCRSLKLEYGDTGGDVRLVIEELS